MSKWEKVKWGTVINIRNGRNQKKVENPNGQYPIYGSGGIMGYATDYLCEENTVIIGRKGNINKPLFVETKFWNVDTAFGLEVDNTKLISKYLYYFSLIFNFEKLSTTVTIPSLTKTNLQSIEMPLPPLEVQKEIAKNLDTVSELLALRKKQLEELDGLIKSVFYDMFGDPVTNEKGWELKLLKDCLTVAGGYAFSSKGFSEKGIPIIKIGNINSGEFRDTNLSFWEYDQRLDKYLLFPNDIVISLTGTVGKDDYANVCILPDSFDRYYLNQRNAKLVLGDHLVTNYLLYVMKDRKIKGQLIGVNRGIRQANISNGDILNLSIPVPPLTLQNQFATIVTKIEEQKALVKQSIEETQTLFNSLMSQYFD